MAGNATQPTLAGIVPGAAPDYGRDLWCTDDLDAGMLEVTGPLALAQALYRRIITPRGSLIDDPNYGFDITQFLNDDLSTTDLARIATLMDAEFEKDERVFKSSTVVTLLTSGVLNVVSTIAPSSGPTFRLVLAATAVSVTLLQAA